MDEVWIQQKVKELKTVQERVEYLLEKYPETRNNDLYLVIRYWREFDGLSIFIPPEFIWGKKKLTSFESIRRSKPAENSYPQIQRY